MLSATFPCAIVLLCNKFPSLDAPIGGHWSVLVRLRVQVNFHQGRACTILAVRTSEVTMGGFNGAWLDRHGIRHSYLGLGVRSFWVWGPSSAAGLTSLPIVNSHAESAAMLTDPIVGYWCRVGSLALTHTRTDIFGAVAIWDQRRTMLSIFVVPPTARLHQGCWLCFIRVLPGLVAAPPGVRAGSGPLV